MTRAAVAAMAAAALAGLAGCAGGGEEGTDLRLELVAADNNIREEGVECAGATPFEFVHAGSAFELEDADGNVLEEGELPAGVAENADPSIDWGVERIPTVCVFPLVLEDVDEAATYVFRLEQGEPLSFDASLLSEDEPLRLLVQ